MSDSDKIKRLWILYMCYISDKYGGLSVQDIFRQQHRDLEIKYSELDKILNGLVNDKLLNPENKPGWAVEVYFYKITEKGKKELKLIKTVDSEFYKILSLLPPEHELKYRLYNLEHFLFHFVLSFIFFKLTLFLFSSKHFIIGLVTFFLTFAFLPFAMNYFIRVAIFTLNQILIRAFGKTSSFLDKNSKQTSNAIVLFLILIALSLIYFNSLPAFLAAIGGIILALILKDGLDKFKSFRDKVEKGINRLKDSLRID